MMPTSSFLQRLFAFLKRPLKNYNIENRARRVVEEPVKKAAPRFKIDEETYQRVMREHPEIRESVKQTDEKLHDRLKSVYVSSTDPFEDLHSKSKSSSTRPLPQRRITRDRMELGYHLPESIPKGKVTLKLLSEMLCDHMTNPNTVNAVTLAKKYGMEQKDVETLLKYYGLFNLHVPAEKEAFMADMLYNEHKGQTFFESIAEMEEARRIARERRRQKDGESGDVKEESKAKEEEPSTVKSGPGG